MKLSVTSMPFIFSTCLLFANFSGFCQKNQAYKAVYKKIDNNATINLPDSVVQPLNVGLENLQITAGEFIYTACYQNGLSRTEIKFEAAPGIHITSNSKAYLFSCTKDSAFFMYENDSLINQYNYELPALSKTTETKSIKGYLCSGYQYKRSDSVKTVLWFSKQLSDQVSPGVYYKGLGGIVEINYLRPDNNWSLQLVSFEKTNEKIDFKDGLSKPKGNKTRIIL